MNRENAVKVLSSAAERLVKVHHELVEMAIDHAVASGNGSAALEALFTISTLRGAQHDVAEALDYLDDDSSAREQMRQDAAVAEAAGRDLEVVRRVHAAKRKVAAK